jgi:hypothetical protein
VAITIGTAIFRVEGHGFAEIIDGAVPVALIAIGFASELIRLSIIWIEADGLIDCAKCGISIGFILGLFKPYIK